MKFSWQLAESSKVQPWDGRSSSRNGDCHRRGRNRRRVEPGAAAAKAAAAITIALSDLEGKASLAEVLAGGGREATAAAAVVLGLLGVI